MQEAAGVRTKEIRALTGLRGLAAIWVMVLHTEFTPHPWSLLRVFIDHGYLAVDLFFVLSGYVMALNYGWMFVDLVKGSEYSTFLRKRFSRTYPLYFAATIVTSLLGFYGVIDLVSLRYESCATTAIIPNLLLYQAWSTPFSFCSLDPPGWSISTEWGAYILFPILCRVTLYGSKYRPWAATIFAALALLGLGLLSSRWLGEQGERFGPMNAYSDATIAPAIRCIAGFTLGLVSYRFSRSVWGIKMKENSAWGLTIALVLVVLLLFRGTDIPTVLLFPLLVVSLSADRGIMSALLGWGPVFFLGEISYSIYLVHFPVLMAANKILASLPHYYREYAIDIGTWVPTLAISTLSYQLIERPARRLLNSGIALRSRQTRII